MQVRDDLSQGKKDKNLKIKIQVRGQGSSRQREMPGWGVDPALLG